jgi:hypothetical protein
MTEAKTETIEVGVDAPATAPELISLSRPTPQAHATMIEGDADEAAERILAVLRERGALAG